MGHIICSRYECNETGKMFRSSNGSFFKWKEIICEANRHWSNNNASDWEPCEGATKSIVTVRFVRIKRLFTVYACSDPPLLSPDLHYSPLYHGENVTMLDMETIPCLHPENGSQVGCHSLTIIVIIITSRPFGNDQSIV